MRRAALSDLEQAVAFRRVQEAAALATLRRRQAAVREAEAAKASANEALEGALNRWAGCLSEDRLDPLAHRLWRAEADRRGQFATEQIAALGQAQAETTAAVRHWSQASRQAETVAAVSDKARKAYRRASEERGLTDAEDLRISRRIRS